MGFRLFLALAAVVGLMMFFGWYGKASPAQRNNALRKIVLYGLIGAIVLLVVTGRIPVLFAAVAALLPWIQRFFTAKRMWDMFKSSRGPSPGQTSKIETRFLQMQLDHDSGELTGTVLAGSFQGADLGQLNLAQLLQLRSECQTEDAQSTAVLEAYLDRRFSDWRDQSGASSDDHAAASGAMSISQAYDILGLDEGAKRDEVIDAHRKLMQKLHPDRGGSTFLASQVNRAKDMILEYLDS